MNSYDYFFFFIYRMMYLFGYILKDNRLYFGDKEFNIVSFLFFVLVLEYQIVVMRRDFEIVDKILFMIFKEYRLRVVYFLEKQVRSEFMI